MSVACFHLIERDRGEPTLRRRRGQYIWGYRREWPTQALWLACEEGCILGEFEESIALPVVEGPAPRERALFDRWAVRLPRRADAADLPFVAGHPVAVGDRFEARLRWLDGGVAPVVDCFPDPGSAIEVDVVETRSVGSEVIVRYKARRLEGLGPPGVSLPFLVCFADEAGRREGFPVDLYPW